MRSIGEVFSLLFYCQMSLIKLGGKKKKKIGKKKKRHFYNPLSPCS